MNDMDDSKERPAPAEGIAEASEKELIDLLADPTLPSRLEEMAALTKRLNELGITDALSMLALRLKKDDGAVGAEESEWTQEEIEWLAEQNGFDEALKRLGEEAKASDPGFADRAERLKARMIQPARFIGESAEKA